MLNAPGGCRATRSAPVHPRTRCGSACFEGRARAEQLGPELGDRRGRVERLAVGVGRLGQQPRQPQQVTADAGQELIADGQLAAFRRRSGAVRRPARPSSDPAARSRSAGPPRGCRRRRPRATGTGSTTRTSPSARAVRTAGRCATSRSPRAMARCRGRRRSRPAAGTGRTGPPARPGRPARGRRRSRPGSSATGPGRTAGRTRADAGGAAPGVVQQHQRQQPGRLRLARHQVDQHPAEPQRLVEQRLVDGAVGPDPPVPRVEHQVEDVQDRRQPRGEVLLKRLQRGANPPQPLFGPEHPLPHRPLADEERVRDPAADKEVRLDRLSATCASIGSAGCARRTSSAAGRRR